MFEKKPWRYPGADLTDYFNFGFDEDSWKQYCNCLVLNAYKSVSFCYVLEYIFFLLSFLVIFAFVFLSNFPECTVAKFLLPFLLHVLHAYHWP